MVHLHHCWFDSITLAPQCQFGGYIKSAYPLSGTVDKELCCQTNNAIHSLHTSWAKLQWDLCGRSIVNAHSPQTFNCTIICTNICLSARDHLSLLGKLLIDELGNLLTDELLSLSLLTSCTAINFLSTKVYNSTYNESILLSPTCILAETRSHIMHFYNCSNISLQLTAHFTTLIIHSCCTKWLSITVRWLLMCKVAHQHRLHKNAIHTRPLFIILFTEMWCNTKMVNLIWCWLLMHLAVVWHNRQTTKRLLVTVMLSSCCFWRERTSGRTAFHDLWRNLPTPGT